ncbi:MAG: glycosyltransferase family 39 protein [Blastocatellia bacterium]
MTNDLSASTSMRAEPVVKPLAGRDPKPPDLSFVQSGAPRTVRLSVDDLDTRRFTRVSAAFFLLAVAVYVVARLWRLTAYGLFGDEVFTFWTADQDLAGVIVSVRSDVVHPPLFYLALKLWIALGGSSILWLKLLPVLFSLGVILPLLLLCRELNMRAAAINLTLGLIAFNAFLVSYAQELRMYSLLMTLTITSLWLFVRLINRERGVARTQVWLIGTNLGLVFTHYYGWVIVGLELLVLLVWKRERARGFAIGVAAIVCAFSPWVYAVAGEAKTKPERVNFVWNAPPGASDFVGYYANLNGALSYRWRVAGTLLVMILFATPIVLWGRRALRSLGKQVGQVGQGGQANGQSITFWWFASFAFAPAVISFCASHVLAQPVWAPRYLIIAAPAYLMMVAAAVFKLPSKRLSVATGIVVMAWAALSGTVDLTSRDRIAWEPLVAKMLLAESGPSRAVNVYSTDPNLGNTIQFYLDRLSEQRCEAVYVQSFEDLPDGHFWVAHISYQHETGPGPHQFVIQHGYEVGAGFEVEAPSQKGFLFPVSKR